MSDVEWRAVVGYEGLYEVSSDGQVRSLDKQVRHYCGGTRLHRGRVLRAVFRQDGYPEVSLYRSGRGKIYKIHRLVLLAFIGPAPTGHEALHGDGDESNAHLSNLRWGSRIENAQDAVRHGTHVGLDRTHCPRLHRLVEPNLVRSQLARGWRMCRACHQARRYPGRDLQQESDRRFLLIMAGTTPGATRRAAGVVPAQRAAQVGTDSTRASGAPVTAPTVAPTLPSIGGA